MEAELDLMESSAIEMKFKTQTKGTQAEAYATEDTPNVPKIGFPIGCCGQPFNPQNRPLDVTLWTFRALRGKLNTGKSLSGRYWASLGNLIWNIRGRSSSLRALNWFTAIAFQSNRNCGGF
jgi:hypothetical protein